MPCYPHRPTLGMTEALAVAGAAWVSMHSSSSPSASESEWSTCAAAAAPAAVAGLVVPLTSCWDTHKGRESRAAGGEVSRAGAGGGAAVDAGALERMAWSALELGAASGAAGCLGAGCTR